MKTLNINECSIVSGGIPASAIGAIANLVIIYTVGAGVVGNIAGAAVGFAADYMELTSLSIGSCTIIGAVVGTIGAPLALLAMAHAYV